MESIMSGNGSHVVACIPYYRCQRYVRRAVESLLAQTHRDLTVVVVNDADFETPPWPALADITDPRLIRFDLTENRGLYFAYAVAVGATNAEFFLTQDADDWSDPNRVRLCLAKMNEERSDFVISVQPQCQETASGKIAVVATHFQRRSHRERSGPTILNTTLDNSYLYRACHHALFRTSTLSCIGGYYGGFRLHYDTLLTNLLLMVGKLSFIQSPLYYRFLWPGAQTSRPETGFGSEASLLAIQQQQQIYGQAFDHYKAFTSSRSNAYVLAQSFQRISQQNVSVQDQYVLDQEVCRLRCLLHA